MCNMKNHTYECQDHPDEEMKPKYNYLGMIDYICQVCNKTATLTKREPETMHYWQNGENGRTCASLKKLAGNWEEITKDAYFEIEKYNSTITSEASVQAISNVAGFFAEHEILFNDGEPCHHLGCRSHISHPCEGCGRIGAQGVKYRNPFCDVAGYNQKLGYRKLLLKREGSTPLTIRDKNGYWQVLEYTDRYGSERWSKPIDEAEYNVEDHIKKYGVEITCR